MFSISEMGSPTKPMSSCGLLFSSLFMLHGHSSLIKINKLTLIWLLKIICSLQFLTRIQELGIILASPPAPLAPENHFLLVPCLWFLTHFLSLLVYLYFLHLPLGTECLCSHSVPPLRTSHPPCWYPLPSIQMALKSLLPKKIPLWNSSPAFPLA